MKDHPEVKINILGKFKDLLERLRQTEHLFIIILAVIVGLLGGFGAVGIRALLKFISDLCFDGGTTLLESISNSPWYIVILAPAIGGLIVGPLIYYFAPEAKGHGVPEVMQAVITRGGVIRPRVALIKTLASSISIGTGGSVGREGPIIQIGSSIGSSIGQLLNLSTRRLKTLVGCGAAAGIAATFNAPIAGAFFAVEIILMDFTAKQLTPIVISSVIATVISHQLTGNYPAFEVPAYNLVSPQEILFYVLLGLICGVISYIFIKSLYFFEDVWDKKFNIHPIFKAGIGGAIIGCIGIFFPHVMGVGYDTITLALEGNLLWNIALLLIFIKIFATVTTLASGGSGGVFAPSLFMGSMAGLAFGSLVHGFFPNVTAEAGAYALVAMGGLVAGTTRAPITAIIIVFEMTKDYNIILPLMIVCTISIVLASKMSRESIYTLKLLLKNIKLRDRAEINLMKSIHVKDVYTKDFEHVEEDADFTEIVQKVMSKKMPFISVWNLKGNFMGTISIEQIKEYLFDKDLLKYLLIAGDIAERNIERVTPYNNCKEALDYMNRSDIDGLPVVAADNPSKQIGMIWRKDIYDAYHKELQHMDLTTDLATKITLEEGDKEVRFLEGYKVSEIKAPDSFAGKSIGELAIRVRYGVDVLSIKCDSQSGDRIKCVPSAEYVIQPGDVLIVAGEAEKIEQLKNLN